MEGREEGGRKRRDIKLKNENIKRENENLYKLKSSFLSIGSNTHFMPPELLTITTVGQ